MSDDGVKWATDRIEFLAESNDLLGVEESLELSGSLTPSVHRHLDAWAKEQKLDSKAFCLGALVAQMATEHEGQ
jgi:hypothetical protein